MVGWIHQELPGNRPRKRSHWFARNAIDDPMRERLTLTLAVVGLLSCASSPRPPSTGAAARAGPAKTSIPVLRHTQLTLDNGLSVILHPDRRLPLVAVSIWYDVGALHEKPGRSGFAHLFEHMMFQASPHVGEDQHFAILQAAGGTEINGTTGFDRTNYFETVPSNELETVLWMESDRMGFLLSSVNAASLKNQIDVVQNERRQSVENRPYGLMDERITQALYPKPHPYHGNVIGSMEDIGAATLPDVQEFFRTYYTPANATLTLAGDFEPEEATRLIERYFGSLVGRPKPPEVNIAAPALSGERVIDFVEPVGRLERLAVAWMGPSAFEADTAALDLLAHVISGTRSARLDRRVSHDDLIAQSVHAHFIEQASGGQFRIDLTVRPGRTLDEAQVAVDEVLAELRATPPTTAELARALNSFETALFRGLESLGGFGGRAERLQLYAHYLGDPGRLAWDVDRYRRVTVQDLSRVLKTYLGPDRLVVRARPQGASS